MAKKLYPFRLEEKMIERLRGIAKEEGRNLSDVVRQALADFLRKRERESKPKSKKGGK